jgi:putative ABC transport system substrate-binding protein
MTQSGHVPFEKLRPNLRGLTPNLNKVPPQVVLTGGHMHRRKFVTLLGGAAAWPLASRAQQGEHVRRIGVLMSAAVESDQPAAVAAFVQMLQQLGWTEGRNVRIDIRWARGDPKEARRYAEELIALPSDVIMATGQTALDTLLQGTRTVPIVFNSIADPVGGGYIDTLARPGGNATGFIQFDYTLAGKWVELLKQIAPNVTRAAVLREPAIAAGVGQFAVIQSVAPSIGMEVSAINLRDAGEIERAITRFASSSNGGLILTTSALSVVHHDLIIALAARHKLPAVYYRRFFVTRGGLISYGYDIFQQFRGAAGYVDRILKGEKPADLPVQAPTKYELVINLKTAKAIGLTMPPSVLARADEVIE